MICRHAAHISAIALDLSAEMRRNFFSWFIRVITSPVFSMNKSPITEGNALSTDYPYEFIVIFI